ncbi:MAG: hypothetical protein H0V07_03545 [Propionibacteriales bacterium]|nr:hypothetical protein [Propionibacteriales bacterium]
MGLPKTGTTYVQSALWDSRDRLASAGCLAFGEKPVSSWRAASDLLGRRPKGADAPDVVGAWSDFVEAVRGWDGDRVIFSEELLGNATRRHVRRVVTALSPCDVHVVVTVRDLARTLPSVWQQEIRKGRTWTWGEFLAAVRDPDNGPATAGVAFWLRFDLDRVLRIWGSVVPAANIHVVVVPPRGTATEVLLGRFAEATGVDPLVLACRRPEVNTALGAVEAEVLRRLNVALASELNEREYTRVVVESIIPALQKRTASPRCQLPDEHRSWAAEKSEHLIESLERQQFHVVGELSDLVSRPEAEPGRDPDDLGDAELVDPMSAALVAACTTYGHFWWRARRRDDISSADAATRLGSRARALGYHLRITVLERADHNKMFGRLARAYLKRESSRS